MSEKRRILAIIATHDSTPDAPIVTDVQAAFVSDPNSMSAYVRDNTEGWFDLSTFDVVGPYALMLPPPPDKRANTVAAAQAAAAAAGVDTGRYDGFVVVLHPGVVAGVGYDGGASGNTVTGRSGDDLTFFCHELGHVLGFQHSYGLLNPGADWTNDGVTQLYPVYGDPYDLMSSASFGGGAPTTKLPGQPIHGMPGIRNGGPMLARAQLHFGAPGALEATGQVRRLGSGDGGELVTLYSAGHGEAGKTELVVFSSDGEDAQGSGRVYVELRVPSPSSYRSRWDAGITAGASDLDRAGVVVHVVKDIPEGGTTAVW